MKKAILFLLLLPLLATGQTVEIPYYRTKPPAPALRQFVGVDSSKTLWVLGPDIDRMVTPIVTLTQFAHLRNQLKPDPGVVYMVVDGGRSGFFRFSTGNQADDDGIYVRTLTGYLFERVRENNIIFPGWYGAKGDLVANDAPAIKKACDAAPFGAVIDLASGRFRFGAGSATIIVKHGVTIRGSGKLYDYNGVKVDTVVRTNIFLIKPGGMIKGLGIWSDTHAGARTDTLQVAFFVPEGDNAQTIEDCWVQHMSVGYKFFGYYLNARGLNAHYCGTGIWDRSRPNLAFAYSGAHQYYSGHLAGCYRAGIHIQGFTATNHYWGFTFEANRIGILAEAGASATFDKCYLGDDSYHSLLLKGASQIVLANEKTDPVHGGNPAFAPPGTNVRNPGFVGGSIRVEDTSILTLRGDINLDNCIALGRGYSNQPGLGTGMDRGWALYVATNARVNIEGRVHTNVYFPIGGDGLITGTQGRVTNYITNGTMTDTLRAPFTLHRNVTASFSASGKNNFGGYVATIAEPATVYYEVPERMVGQTMKFGFQNRNTTGSIALLKPGTDPGVGYIPSSGWTLVANNSTNWQGFGGDAGDRVAFSAAPWADQAMVEVVEVRITAKRGAFTLFAFPGTSKVGFVFLVESRNFQQIAPLDDASFVHVAAAMPTLGTWVAGDEVLNTNRTVQGSAGSRYVVDKWLRLTPGNGHVLNTDWAEQRLPTGN